MGIAEGDRSGPSGTVTIGGTQVRTWAIPLVGAGLLAVVGWTASQLLERSMKEQLREQLETILEADVTALELWAKSQKSAAQQEADQPRTRQLIGELLELVLGGATDKETLVASAPLLQLRAQLEPAVWRHEYVDFVVLDPTGRVIAARSDELIGEWRLADRPFVRRVSGGVAVVSAPFRANVPLPSDNGTLEGERPTMFVAAPVRGNTGGMIAVLGFRIRPEVEFTPILTVAQMGESGETYAFDSDGLMVSQSRFEAHLRAIGLLPDDPAVQSMLNVEIRDPGGNMLEGFVPETPRAGQPLTLMASEAVAGNGGFNVDGYRDYRGVPVVGAWTWLPELGIGVTTEVDVDEAYGTLTLLRTGFWGLFGLLVISSLGILYNSRVVARLQREVVEAHELGQYQLKEKIGEGGMGRVYRASHTLLRRPTAIKLILSEGADDRVIARFEREVQFTAGLSHPNTIAIYDYGRTEDGVFYYAMEYLDGLALKDLVREDGRQPEARVIHILRQVCGSLAEAHSMGFIHRDIKPANIMLCERGGLSDFVKVLDFGLVRHVEEPAGAGLTAANTVAGTPTYISPEAIEAPDAVDEQSDLYQLGAVAYFLITGQDVFTGNSMEVCSHHLHTEPEQPSARIGEQVENDLEALILSCLSKNKEDRPASAAGLLQALDECKRAGKWSQEDARRWWGAWREARDSGSPDELAPEAAPATGDRAAVSESTELVIDLGNRPPPGESS